MSVKSRVTAADENYLEAVLMIQNRAGAVRSVDLAEQLGVTKASVSVKVHALISADLLCKDAQNYLHLTESGLQIAERIYERHLFLTDALISLGIDPETAEDDACHMEHHVSDETFSAMKAYCAENRQLSV